MNEKSRLLIVENDTTLAEDLAFQLTEMGYLIAGITDSYDNTIDILEEIDIDVAIIDVSINGSKDGIQLAEAINMQQNLPLIFITSKVNVSIINRLKMVNPYAFMLLPINYQHLQGSIELSISNYCKSVSNNNLELSNTSEINNQVMQLEDCLFLKKRDNYFERVDLNKILWIEANSNYTNICTIKGNFTYAIVLKKIDEKLPKEKFVRVHRSYIVNIENVTGFEGTQLCLGEKQIPVSKPYRDELFKKFMVI